MSQRRVLLTLFFLTTVTCHARLGESLAECDQRYGQPVESNLTADESGKRTYATDFYALTIHFKKGVARAIAYQKRQRDANGLPKPSTSAEIKYLLAVNGQNNDWKLFENSKRPMDSHEETLIPDPASRRFFRRWRRDDRLAFAIYDNRTHRLTIWSEPDETRRFKILERTSPPDTLNGL